MTNPMRHSPEAALAWELDAIVMLEHLIRSAQGELFRRFSAAESWAAEVEGVTESSGPDARSMATRSFIAELGTTLTVHEATAGRLVDEARRLNGARRATLDALESGAMSLTQVRSVLELTQGIEPDAADQVESVAVEHARGRTNGELRRALRRVRERVQATPLDQRRRAAAAERRVCLDPAPDGMAWLGILLEADRAVAVVERLSRLADQPAADDAPDDRTKAQREADLAGDLLLSGVVDPNTHPDLAAAIGRIRPRINVTVPMLSLLGLSDEPAELEGYGPIDPDTARRLTAHAPSFRRVLVHPETGAILSYGRKSYRVPADLAGFLRMRDGQCRFPGCTRPASRTELDHTEPWVEQNDTAHDNLACVCDPHHRLKHKSGWKVEQEPGGVLRWSSPAGHDLRTYPERPFIPVTAESRVMWPPPEPVPPNASVPPPDPVPSDDPASELPDHPQF
jgi:hypothetical protein